MSSARTVKRLKAVAVVWWVLAAIPLLVAVSVKWFSLAVVVAVLIRGALGMFAWKRAQALATDPNATLGVARVVYLLAPVILFAGGIFFERQNVPVHEPSFCTPEWVLPRRGSLDGRAWFGDRDNPSMAMAAGMLVALSLGIAIAAARKPSAPR